MGAPLLGATEPLLLIGELHRLVKVNELQMTMNGRIASGTHYIVAVHTEGPSSSSSHRLCDTVTLTSELRDNGSVGNKVIFNRECFGSSSDPVLTWCTHCHLGRDIMTGRFDWSPSWVTIMGHSLGSFCCCMLCVEWCVLSRCVTSLRSAALLLFFFLMVIFKRSFSKSLLLCKV